MTNQLHLLPLTDESPWRLDTLTREVGRRGVAQARAALRDARTASDRPARPARPSSHSHLRAQIRRTAA